MKRTPLRRKTALRARKRLRQINPQRKAARFRQQFGSEGRVAWLKGFPCISCGTRARIQYSHARHGPTKTADEGVPQCADCHQDVHDRGIKTHQADYRVDLAAEARRFARLWREYYKEVS